MFINDGRFNYLKGKTLYVSKIFSWYRKDFPDDFIGWFSRYARGDLKKKLDHIKTSGGQPKVKYLKYDWSLNKMAR